MPSPEEIKVVGPCGATYHFKSEYSGVLMQCPSCRKVYRVPDVGGARFSDIQRLLIRKEGVTAEVEPEGIRPPWQRRYEMRQEVWTLDEIYGFYESGKPELLTLAERRRRLHNVAVYAVLVSFLFGAALLVKTGMWPLAGGLFGVALAALVIVNAICLRFKFFKRHIVFYSGHDRLRPEFRVRDMTRLEFPKARFRVEDNEGNKIGHLVKPWFGDVLRSPWWIYDQHGHLVFIVQEESLVLSLLRRIFVAKLWWFRTNFVLLEPTTEELCGEFTREWTLKDHYVLDLTENRTEVDVRILWALSALLDSAERR
jgi:hypothetical protein